MHYGLDFGTTNSAIAIQRKTGKVETIPVDTNETDTQTILRSLLYYRKKTKKHFVGSRAIHNYLKDSRLRKLPRFRVFDTGKKVTIPIPTGNGGFWYYEADLTYREDINNPGQLMQALKTSLREGFSQPVNLFGDIYPLEELIAMILSKMKNAADRYMGSQINNVILGRPVHYGDDITDAQIQNRMEQAARLAGFTTVQFVPEPVAAAYDYIGSHQSLQPQIVLVFDFGGGTLDFCLLQQNKDELEILATDGLSIGGDLFNELIMDHKISPSFGINLVYGPKNLPMPAALKHSLRKWYEIESLKSPELQTFLAEVKQNTSNPRLVNNLITLIDYNLGFELFQAIEKAKIQLSHKNKSKISFHQRGINLDIPVSRDEFETMITPQVNQIEQTLRSFFQNVTVEAEDVNTVVCTGGASYTPFVQKRLVQLFPKSNIGHHNVFEGIAAGLARIKQT